METRKTALVTGAAKGIGRQIAYCMAEAGYNVIVNYHSNKAAAEELCREMEKFGVQTMTVYADMGKVADIEEMYRQVFEVFPVVDVLVNNAGISSEVTVYSIVNTLCELSNVNRVQFTIDGEPQEQYGEMDSFHSVLERNLDIVESEND